MGTPAADGRIAVQNFASAAVGMAVAVALVRGFQRSRSDRIGNFWVDLVRGYLRIPLPLAAKSGRCVASSLAERPSRSTRRQVRRDAHLGWCCIPEICETSAIPSREAGDPVVRARTLSATRAWATRYGPRRLRVGGTLNR